MSRSEMTTLSAVELTSAFRRRALSPVEVLDAQVEADERLGATINAFTERFSDEARKEALHAERCYLRAEAGEILPSLLGITVAVKASHDMRGKQEDLGVRPSDGGRIAAEDHPVVGSLREAGAILHARTTTPEFNCATVTHSRRWGVTRNPWNLELSPGGSSGGSAAAVASGFSTMATGSDLAGSIRIPASFSGLVGFKPPWGVVPGVGPMSADTYSVQGGLTRTVDDAILFMRAVSRPGNSDIHAWRGIGDALVLPSEPAPLRIGLSRDLGGYDIDADVESNMLVTAQRLEGLGHRVGEVRVTLDPDEVHRAAFAHFGHIFLEARRLRSYDPCELSPYTREFIEQAERQREHLSYYAVLEREHGIQQRLIEVFDHCDVLLCPTTGVSSLPAGGNFVDASSGSGHYWKRHLTLPFNIAHALPAISVPNGMGFSGAPTSVQLVAPVRNLPALFGLARQVEALHPIGRPPLLE